MAQPVGLADAGLYAQALERVFVAHIEFARRESGQGADRARKRPGPREHLQPRHVGLEEYQFTVDLRGDDLAIGEDQRAVAEIGFFPEDLAR